MKLGKRKYKSKTEGFIQRNGTLQVGGGGRSWMSRNEKRGCGRRRSIPKGIGRTVGTGKAGRVSGTEGLERLSN